MKSTKEFATVVEGFREDFMAKGPFTTHLSVGDAKVAIAEYPFVLFGLIFVLVVFDILQFSQAVCKRERP